MGYTHTTLGTLKTQLAARLHDSGKVFFVDAELGVYLTEALRTFSLLSAFWRTQQSFNTVASTFHYDLPTVLSAYIGHTVTDQDVINAMQYHLQEPATSVWAGGWTGTAMFTMADVVYALQRRRDQFLVETGVVLTRSSVSLAPTGGRITVADTIMDIRRLVWIDGTTYTHLWRVDENELTSFFLGATTPWSTASAQTPRYYSVMTPPPITVQLAPAPSATKTQEIISVSSGATLNPTAGSTVLGVPDDMAWIVKWGALADLLSKDGPAQDLARAKYCEERYQHGVQVALYAPLILAARISSVPLLVHSLHDMDSFKPNWQNDAAAAPTRLLIAGRNLVYVYPSPVGVTSITLDFVQNAPIPATDATQVEIGREQLEAIIDYAEHLAMFKVAGDEWEATNSGLENLMRVATNYNSRLSAAAKYLPALGGKPTKEEEARGRFSLSTGHQ